MYNLLHDVNAIQQDDFVCDNNQYYLNHDTHDLLHNVNAIQQDDFVCDNNQYYLNNNDCDPVSNNDNANSIQDIVDTIFDVKMNGIFYIPVKKKYILYLLFPKKKRSFHTSKKKIDISNYLDNKVPSQSQSLFNSDLVDTFRVRVHVHDNDTIRISLNGEPCTVQYSKHQKLLYCTGYYSNHFEWRKLYSIIVFE